MKGLDGISVKFSELCQRCDAFRAPPGLLLLFLLVVGQRQQLLLQTFPEEAGERGVQVLATLPRQEVTFVRVYLARGRTKKERSGTSSEGAIDVKRDGASDAFTDKEAELNT